MIMEIKPISIPRSVIRDIPPPVTNTTPPPVTSSLEAPVVEMPEIVIEYPTIDVPTEQDFRQQISTPPPPVAEEGQQGSRDLPPPAPPTINIGGIEAPLPEPAPLITAGATAVVTTAVTLTAVILVNKFKELVLEPLLKKLNAPKKKKIKVKQVKPVLHYILNDDGIVDILEYSQKGTKVIGNTDNVERYIRDQVENDSLYEMDNKIIIDDVIKEKFTKEGAKRFKSLFAPAKTIAKKLSAKFSF
jgi:hypothetical protein